MVPENFTAGLQVPLSQVSHYVFARDNLESNFTPRLATLETWMPINSSM